MAAIGKKPEQVFTLQGGGLSIHQRMQVQVRMGHERFVNIKRHLVSDIIHQGKRTDRTRGDTQVQHHPLYTGEAEAASTDQL